MPEPSFEQLIAPRSTEAFVAEVWQRRAAWGPIDAGLHARLAAAIPRPEYEARLDDLRLSGRIKLAWRDAAGHQLERVVGPAGVAARGPEQTLCVSHFELVDELVAALARATGEALALSAPALVNLYDSPPGRGFALHFDCQSVFVIQLAGTKRWRFGSRPALCDPVENLRGEPEAVAAYRSRYPWAEVELPTRAALDEHTLVPGELLYLPAGTFHEAEAGDAGSLALTLTCPSTRVSQLLATVLCEALDADPKLRRNLGLADEQTLAAGLDRARDQLARLELGDLRFALLDALHGTSTAAPPLAAASPSDPEPGPRLEPEQHLVVPARVDYLCRGDSLFVFAGEGRVELPAAALAWVEALAGCPRFVAREACSWTAAGQPAWPWPEVRALLEALIETGIVAPC